MQYKLTPEEVERIRAQRIARAERRAARRLEWAEGREMKANQAGEQARSMASVIPFGQPILIGHHSERRDRAYRGRIHSKLGQEQEHLQIADYHRQKASNILAFGTRVRGDAERAREEKRQEQDALIMVGATISDFAFGRGIVVKVNKKTYTIKFESGGTWARDKTYVQVIQ